ncbi:hypothetical protein DFS34DRAFT_12262 [Phlyctochytrium arcticum]|nr:hypothetical protein DFS34DRAFT_12262 [Phlyctochytrium arcticum]
MQNKLLRRKAEMAMFSGEGNDIQSHKKIRDFLDKHYAFLDNSPANQSQRQGCQYVDYIERTLEGVAKDWFSALASAVFTSDPTLLFDSNGTTLRPSGTDTQYAAYHIYVDHVLKQPESLRPYFYLLSQRTLQYPTQVWGDNQLTATGQPRLRSYCRIPPNIFRLRDIRGQYFCVVVEVDSSTLVPTRVVTASL